MRNTEVLLKGSSKGGLKVNTDKTKLKFLGTDNVAFHILKERQIDIFSAPTRWHLWQQYLKNG
jgi:hypothetical protein